MTEIWVPYGLVEVSFDIKQENLSQILEPQSPRISQEELERNADLVLEETVLLFSGSQGVQKTLDILLMRNKGIRKILYTNSTGQLARRKAQEFGIEVEPLNIDNLVEIGVVDGSPASAPAQLKNSGKMLVLTSIHYDPLYGLTSAASDLVNQLPDLKKQAFNRSSEDLPCPPTKSNASMYATRVLEACQARVMEVVEKTTSGISKIFYGEPEQAHLEAMDFWAKNLSVTLNSKSQHIIFGSGGLEHDKTLTDALASSFFQVATNVAQQDSDSKVCMLAECSQGLGSEALLRFVTGRFEPRTKLDPVAYFDGLEVLLSFHKVQRDLQLSILTTLPKFYASKFDFKTIGGAREAPGALVERGSRAKILVVTDASSSYFT